MWNDPWSDAGDAIDRDDAYPMAPVRTAAPTADLWTLAEVKAQLSVDHDNDDGLIAALLVAATARLDGRSGILGRALLPQTWRQDFRCFPWQGRMRLPLEPVTSVTGVTYYDGSNVQRTLATSVYAGPLADALGPYIKLQFGQTWPVSYVRDDAVSVTFNAGYATASDVPGPIRHAALLLVGAWYATRENSIVSERVMSAAFPDGVEALIAPYRAGFAF